MMCSHHSRSNEPDQALGLLLCLLVGAYIYYLTSSHQHRGQAPEQTQDPLNEPTLENTTVTDCNPNPLTPVDDLRKSFEAGMKAYMQFDMQDLQRMKHDMVKMSHESREREKRIEAQIKAWREEQLKRLWADKQRGEKGFGGWLRFGSLKVRGRDEGKEVVKDAVLKRDVKVSAVKEIGFVDEKKG